MPQPTSGVSYPAPRAPGTGAGAVVAVVLVGVWVVGTTVALQSLGWLVDQGLLMYGVARPWWMWPAISMVNAALVAVPAALLMLLTHSAVRAIGWVWLAGAAAVGLLGALRAVPAGEPELRLALVVLAALVLALLWRRGAPPATAPRAGGPAGPPAGAPTGPPAGAPTGPPAGAPAEGGLAGGVLIAGAAGLVLLLPWLWVGALGGALETVLALAAAAATGWLAATLLDQRLWRWFGPRRVLVGGLVAGVALLLLAAGVGASGTQLPLLLVLPPLGFATAAFGTLCTAHRYASPRPGAPPEVMRIGVQCKGAVGVLVGLAALGPLALVDPRELNLFLMVSRDVPFWVAVAAAGSCGSALLLGVVLRFGLGPLLGRRPGPRPGPRVGPEVGPGAGPTAGPTVGPGLGAGRPARRGRRAVAAALAAVVAVAAGGVYVGLGQPGLYGERLFVVLTEQADLTGLPAGTGQAGRDARASEVYRRLVSHAQASQADLRAELDRLRLPYTPYYLVNAVEVAGGPELRAWLSRRSDVDRVLRSQQLRPLPAPAPQASGTAGLAPDDPEWNIAMIGADRVWDELGVTGTGVVVGSSDSGVDGTHPALASGFRGGGDSWLDPWDHTATPTDRGGHGTHTLGSAVGRGGIGVAPGAQWTGCANLDRGLGNPALYLDCLQFMLAPYPAGGDPWRDGRPRRAPHVLTNSWGCPPIEGCDRGALRPATAALTAAGIYPVVAAGNAGPFCESIHDPPAPYPEVLTVGAVDKEEQVAFFSSRGPVAGRDKPDLVAPGARVVSAMPGGGYATLDGTSMATPHVAGVVALMWSANPALIGDVAGTTDILHDTARPVPVDEPAACGGPPALVGAGLVDAYGAVAAALDGR